MKKTYIKTALLFTTLLFYSFSQGQSLLHYWNFNNNTSVATITTPTVSNISGASLTANISGSSIIDPAAGTGSNFSLANLNAQNGDPSGTHLRFNLPIGSELVFALPTTGYQNIVVKFATNRSGSGAGTQVWSYSIDGTNYTAFTNVIPSSGNPALATLDFSAITAANNNANFKIKVEFQQGGGGTVGNNRFDNFTAEGTSLGGASDTTAPVATILPINGGINVNAGVNPTIAFNESVRLLDNSAITNANVDAVVELRLNNASGALVPFDATFTSNTITINPTSNLANNQLYYVALLSNTIEDGSDNAITTTQLASFTTSTPSTSSIDLSTYVRVARYNLPEPLTTSAPTNNLLCQEASAVAYNWDTDTLFITADGSTSVTQVSKTGVLIDTMTMAQGSSPQGTDFYDTEGITYIGNGQFVMSEERDRQLVKFTYAAGTTLTRANAQTVKIGTFVPNTGTEGLCYDPLTGGFICLKEIGPIGIFQTNVDFAAGTATNGSATTTNSVDLFDPALLGFSDVADVFVLANLPSQSMSPNLLVLGQENAEVVNIDRNGNIASTLTIVADPSDTLSAPAQQHEGITMDNNGIIYIVNENGGGDINHPQLWVYAPSNGTNQAPTALALNNTVPSIIENAITTPAVKVADILLTDDGLGTNTYSLSGADALSFQITGASLFIKPGTVLDFETKSTFNVTVNVDDTTVGATPDASVNFVLSVTDLVDETPQLPSVTISEVAPWGSGNSPAAADWFEVTNNGATALNITGWKVDDNSNSFASSLALTGITSIAPGESVIFLESSAANPAATVTANFKSLWFGANPPAGLQVGTYQGSGIGLSTGGDAVNLYDAAGVLQANVVFGASPTVLFKTFNNAVGLNSTAISLLSEVGVNDAFVAVNDVTEIGSPGSVGRLFISEVAPWSSGNSPVGADWFEVTNTKAVAVNIAGWKMDDNSQSPAGAVALNGITSINPGESVIFIETSDLPGKTTVFLNNWFGTNPSGSLRIGNYTGSGVGLGTGGDQVNLYNSGNVLQTSVLFGASPATAPYTTFDNKAGVNSLVTAITQFSAVSFNGAFTAANSPTEIGSPGTIITAPCPIITATATPLLATVCTGSTTTVTVTATGGTLPYTVTGSPLTIGAGTYTYTVTDAKGCTATATTTVTSLPTAAVNLSVTTSTASETAATIVTVTATASAAVCVNETISLGITGNGITATDYTLSNATITIPSGSTIGTVTFTVLNDNTVEPTETAVLTISNPSSGITLGTTTTQNISISDFAFTLQVLHASDFEGAVDAVSDAPRFAAIVDVLEDTYTNTIKLSSGDNYIPGPFLSSGEDPSLSAALKTAYESYYNTTFSSSAINLLPSIGRADISILNFIGIEASALGNHEFDLGTTEVRNIIRGANSSATVRSWFGAQFPYLSSNLNFSGDSNLSAIATTNRLLPNTSFQSNPTEAVSAITNKLKLAPSTIIMKGGQKIGIVGATTQVLASISSPGATTVVGGGANDMTILAGIVQPVVDALIADGCNKIILLSHLQQIAFEKELAGKLTGVDIIIAGGSNTLLADANDRLRAGDVAAESYPFLTTGLDGKALALINTDGNYKYVGRLVVDFDAEGKLIPSSINPVVSGVYAADAQGLNDAWGANVGNAFAVGTRGYQVQLLCNAINNVIIAKDGNLFGKTSVYLEGQRNFVRTQETNLGNVSAEANLWLAKFYDPTTVISIKNGGGIRSSIGNVIAVGDNVTFAPPIANPSAGKQSGDISQLDIENSLRFNNQLSLVTLTASGLRSVLEHAVAATNATATPGQFAQVAGVRYSYNFSNAVGSRILNAVVTDANGNVIDTLVLNGTTVGNLSRTFRVVTLNFLAGGGDSYPFNTLGTTRVDLNTLTEQGPAMASFTNAGSEQDAFAEFMKNQYSTTPYGIADTPLVNDCRIQRVPARADNVIPPSAGSNGTLSIALGATVVESQLFAALVGTPQAGGTWSPAAAGAGVYTYTVTSPSCSGSSSATVTVTETIPTTMSFCQGAKVASAIGTTSLKFYSAVTGGTLLLATATLTTRTVFATLTVNGVETAPRVAVSIIVNPLPSDVVGTITSNTPSATSPTGFDVANIAVGQFVGTTTIVSYRIPASVGPGLSYLWKVPTGVTIVGQAANVNEVTQTGTNANILNVHYNNVPAGVGIVGAISVRAVNANGCGGVAKSITVSKALPFAPIAITMTDASLPLVGGVPTAITTFAQYMGTSKEVTLTATTAATATSYVWELPTGVNVTNNSATNTNGVISSTSNFITVNFLGVTNTNTYNYMSTDGIPTSTNNLRIGVYSKNGTGLSTTDNTALTNSSSLFVPNSTSTARLLTLTAVRPAAPAALKMYNAASSLSVAVIDISKFIGTSTPLTLIATPARFASAYSWELPAFVNVVAGSDITASTIVVNFQNVPAGTSSFYIGVKAVNGMGASITDNFALTLPTTTSEAKLLKVTAKAPAVAGIVNGSLAICATTASSVVYSIPTAAIGANTYNVTVPVGCTINGGTTTTASIDATTGATFTVNYPAAFVANTSTAIKTIAIQSVNGFGVSDSKILKLTNVGAICGSSSKTSNLDSVENEFTVTAFPVPSTDVFTIAIQSPSAETTSVNVFDMQGRLIDKFKSDATSFQLGNTYPTGVYMVMVAQGANVKTLRVIKK